MGLMLCIIIPFLSDGTYSTQLDKCYKFGRSILYFKRVKGYTFLNAFICFYSSTFLLNLLFARLFVLVLYIAC